MNNLILEVSKWFHKMVLKKIESRKNDLGVSEEVVVDEFVILGAIRKLKATELLYADALKSKSTHRLYTEYSDNLRRGDVVQDGDLRYRVTYVYDVMQFGVLIQADLRMIS